MAAQVRDASSGSGTVPGDAAANEFTVENAWTAIPDLQRNPDSRNHGCVRCAVDGTRRSTRATLEIFADKEIKISGLVPFDQTLGNAGLACIGGERNTTCTKD